MLLSTYIQIYFLSSCHVTLCSLSYSYVNCQLFPVNSLWLFFFLWCCVPTQAMASSFLRFLDHTQRHVTVSRTPLYEWSAHHRDLCLMTCNTKQPTDIDAPTGIQTHSLSRRAAADLCLRPYCHWDRHLIWLYSMIIQETEYLTFMWLCIVIVFF